MPTRGGGGLLYLSHIIIAHYNASYGCGKCLKQDFVSSSTLHNHKEVCIGFVTKKGDDGSHSGSTRATPKKDSKAPATYSQGSSTLPASQTLPCHSGQVTCHHHKSHKDSKDSSGDKNLQTLSTKLQTPMGPKSSCGHAPADNLQL